MRMARNSMVILLLLAAVLFLAGVSPAAAATVTVTNTNDSGPGSLRQAITEAMGTAAADTINFSISGTITLASDLPDIVSAGGSLTIDGTGQAITVSGGGIARAFYLHDFATLNLLNLAIVNCTKPLDSGGAIEVYHGTLNVTNCTLSGNFTGGYGGGIDISFGTVTISNSTFSGNSAIYGGGAIYNSDTLTITNSTFTGNSSTGSYSAYEGGAIYNGGPLEITNSTFSGNTTANNGGAIANHDVLTITNSTFYGNSAAVTGGAIWNGNGLTITSSTFSGNGAPDGGGIYNSNSEATLRNTVVANSTGGGNCSSNGEGIIINGSNNIDSGTSCGWGSSNGSRSNTDPMLGTLANNGGPTQTMALLAGSPAIDGVTFSSPNGAPSTDQRGVTRPQGALYDIGAYEYQQQAAAPTTVPTMNEWGMIIFMLFAGLGSVYYMRRRGLE